MIIHIIESIIHKYYNKAVKYTKQNIDKIIWNNIFKKMIKNLN